MNSALVSPQRDGARLDALTAELIARFGRERAEVYSLDRMRRLMRHLGSPQESYQVVHVAGTSGKTSSCYAIRDLLEFAGVRTGLTISPHTSHLDERVQVAGQPLDTDRFVAHINALLTDLEDWDEIPSFFEFMAAAAFWIFAQEGVQIAVIEVGLGGRLDATNVVDRADKVCAIAQIGLDHTEVLGTTLPQIAKEKGGIVQPGNSVLVQEQGDEVINQLRACAVKARAVRVVAPRRDLPEHLGHQRANTALAAAVYETLAQGYGLQPLHHRDLMRVAAAAPPGRFERLTINGSTVLLDTAHNAQKLTALRDRALLVLPTPFTLCVAFSDAPELKIVDMVAELAAFAPERLVATEYRPGLLPTGKRAVPAEFIATLARTTGIETVLEPDPDRAAQLSQELAHGAVLITGSTFLVAQTRPGIVAAAANDPSSNGPSRATHG